MSEEEAFWMLTMLLETFIPMDYYSNVLGVIVDQNALDELVEEKIPDLHQHLQDSMFSLGIVSFQWFSCLFSHNFSFDIIARIWDLFFLKGSKIIFRISLAILHMMKKQLLSCTQFDEINNVFNSIPA